MFHKEPDADQILPNLWLGNYRVAMDKAFLQKHRIQYVINVTTDVPCVASHVNYFHLKVARKFCHNYMTPVIDQAVEFIHKGLKQGAGVLVHCKKGHHRSASIVLAYLIKYKGVDFDVGRTYIRQIRPTALKRPACMVRHTYQYYLDLLNLTT